jgi:Mg2+ and Co2+ transporter CorA
MSISPHATRVQDFASAPPPTSPGVASDPSAPPHLIVDTHLDEQRRRGRSATSTTATAAHPNPEELLSPDRASFDSTLRRRITRSHTVKHYQSPTRPYQHQEPGAEPGVDTKKALQEGANYHHLYARCQITVVDFSDERVECHELDNDTLEDFLSYPKEDWVACRWVNINGLSWDVIRTLGNHKQLHRLAIEDLMSTQSRTKVDWYSDQAFCTCDPLRGFRRMVTNYTQCS